MLGDMRHQRAHRNDAQESGQRLGRNALTPV